MKSILKSVGAAVLGGAVVLGSYKILFEPTTDSNIEIAHESIIEATPVSYTGNAIPNAVDFTEAAEKTVHAVVHVKNLTVSRGNPTMQDLMYGRVPLRQTVGTGSGVIITKDGYIVTNNHVIENSRALQVTLNDNRTYEAEVIGTEPGSDIALIKIDVDEDLPVVAFGDSDQARIGEWVLAVGNPFNLTSTVTAGIISAKGRDLNTRDQTQQSFLQTDAAVNPGNSGGALVNNRGELIGINTAIQSPTGSYTGYSFAVPSNNARKIIQDLMEFGFVQKGMLGISGGSLNGRAAAELGLQSAEGIYVSEVVEDSGADRAGLKKGDIITNIDGVRMKSFADLSGYVGTKNPGDFVAAAVLRDGRERSINIEITKNNTVTIPELDMDLRDLTDGEKRQYKIDNGALITGTKNSLANTNLSGYVITKVNETEVKGVESLKSIMDQAQSKQRLIFEVKNPQGETERWRMTKD
ncbi:Do/DeqQ family serine protease [Nonlabens sp. Hel1_33_55]|uniref:trypsin-like peptidase domain-containing protein n=1 Tax=Nonlabens sp. Hel1_33_55 TaxID=1336802 RepID=UPI000875C146|nr:trypsin-like peptidase domain-containing protein [Nonlabens sp. Hel1_33_55]SCY09788.1 Do/DeqQ family serine protease [Nonlabens sp. Hel1_33_55]